MSRVTRYIETLEFNTYQIEIEPNESAERISNFLIYFYKIQLRASLALKSIESNSLFGQILVRSEPNHENLKKIKKIKIRFHSAEFFRTFRTEYALNSRVSLYHKQNTLN